MLALLIQLLASVAVAATADGAGAAEPATQETTEARTEGAPQRSEPAAESVSELAGRMAEALAPHVASMSIETPRYLPVHDGWITKASIELFATLNPELFDKLGGARKHQQLQDSLADPLEAIVDTERQLARRGIELLVVPLPGRLNLYPDAVVECELPAEFAGCAPGLARFVERLRARGIEVLDVVPVLAAGRGPLDAPEGELVYLRANGHWTPRGAALAAEAIAEQVRSRAWFQAEPPATADSTRLVTVHAAWEVGELELAEGAEPPQLDFERVLDAAGEPAAWTDAQSPVVLWGDSFSTIYRSQAADLPRRLHHALGGAVDVVAVDGGGPHAVRAAFARRRDALSGKRMVIWTFASRSLLAGGWERVRLGRR